MENEAEILGYIRCRTCNQPKSVKQGKGKRSKFVHARCSCGPDTRTGAAAQSELMQYKPLQEVEKEIEDKNKSVNKVNIEPNKALKETEKETVNKPNDMSTAASVGAGVVVGLLFGGIFKIIKVVA